MKCFRNLLKILGASIAIILIILLWDLERVDYTPYFESDYYNQTRSRFDSISTQIFLAKGEVEAGFGSRKGTFAEGIHDSLFVKVLPAWSDGFIGKEFAGLPNSHHFKE